MTAKNAFQIFARNAASLMGTAYAFAIALTIIIVWSLSGPLFGFSDTWQLVINTGTTVVTFLAVFLIQNQQNRDAKAVHLKLDEIIYSLNKARNKLIDAEDLTEEELLRLEEEFRRVREAATARTRTHSDVPSP